MELYVWAGSLVDSLKGLQQDWVRGAQSCFKRVEELGGVSLDWILLKGEENKRLKH